MSATQYLARYWLSRDKLLSNGTASETSVDAKGIVCSSTKLCGIKVSKGRGPNGPEQLAWASLQEAEMKLGSRGQAVSTWINSSYSFGANLLPLLLNLREFPRSY